MEIILHLLFSYNDNDHPCTFWVVTLCCPFLENLVGTKELPIRKVWTFVVMLLKFLPFIKIVPRSSKWPLDATKGFNSEIS